MSRGLSLVLIAGAGWFAWSRGWFGDLLPDGGATVGPASFRHDEIDTLGRTIEERTLLENWLYVQPWARRNLTLTASIMWWERGGASLPNTLNPGVKGSVITAGANKGDRAHGMMQVMPKTARWLHDDLGYGLIEPTAENLLTVEGTIYFGTAFLEWLSKTGAGKDEEWIIRSYNGGPGHRSLSVGSAAKRENDGYYKRVAARKKQLISKERMA